MVLILPLCAFILSLVLSYYMLRHALRWGVVCLMVLLVIAFAWAIWQGRQAQGWDGIGYAIVAILGCLPAFLGAALGWVLGWLRNRKDRKLVARRTPD
jgi:hypothetical protein